MSFSIVWPVVIIYKFIKTVMAVLREFNEWSANIRGRPRTIIIYKTY